MTDESLTGYEFTDEEGLTLRVAGYWTINTQYLVVDNLTTGDRTVRLAGLVRRHRQLKEGT
jgi:hypothetical protein